VAKEALHGRGSGNSDTKKRGIPARDHREHCVDSPGQGRKMSFGGPLFVGHEPRTTHQKKGEKERYLLLGRGQTTKLHGGGGGGGTKEKPKKGDHRGKGRAFAESDRIPLRGGGRRGEEGEKVLIERGRKGGSMERKSGGRARRGTIKRTF